MKEEPLTEALLRQGDLEFLAALRKATLNRCMRMLGDRRYAAPWRRVAIRRRIDLLRKEKK